MKISIVTISYNQAQFLEQAIRSVIDQDYPDIEYIVVDPGSTDGSREIIEKYRSKITHVIYEPDMGPSDGLNKGFKLASGDILGFLNSDDYLLPSTIRKVVDYFSIHPNVDVVSGNAHIVDGQNKLLRYTYSDPFSLIACAYGSSILIQPSTFFRANAFRLTNGFNVDNRSNWDSELFVDMKIRGAKFGLINDYLSAYRVYENNITGSGNLDKRIQAYSEKRFQKIQGREYKSVDRLLTLLFRIFRLIGNPRDTCQRIRFGPIYKRYSKEKR